MRKYKSIKEELLKKSREAALTSVQIFNNPNISFKSETYIVLMVIAWTYLLHAYFREKKIDYRYVKSSGKRRVFSKTKNGAYKYWELEKCITTDKTPLEKNTINNLKFLLGLRHEIEHQMTNKIDDLLSARFQACCLNYNKYIKKLFGEKNGIDKHLAFSLQFSTISTEQKDLLSDHSYLPANIQGYIKNFDSQLSKNEFQSQSFGYRVLFVPKTVNKPGQADKVIEFVKSDSPIAKNLNKEYAVIKETEKKKYLPTQIVALMREEGFISFSMHQHTQLWKKLDAKNTGKGFGVAVAGKHWHWYESWVDTVRQYCKNTIKTNNK